MPSKPTVAATTATDDHNPRTRDNVCTPCRDLQATYPGLGKDTRALLPSDPPEKSA